MGKISLWNEILSCIHQGSVLGLLLFTTRVQYLCKIFAVDTSFLSKGFHSKASHDAPTRDLNKVES